MGYYLSSSIHHVYLAQTGLEAEGREAGTQGWCLSGGKIRGRNEWEEVVKGKGWLAIREWWVMNHSRLLWLVRGLSGPGGRAEMGGR